MAKVPSDLHYIVSGRITDQHDQPIVGLLGTAYDQDPNTPANPLVEPAVTDAYRKYQIELSQKEFRIGGVESGGPDFLFGCLPAKGYSPNAR